MLALASNSPRRSRLLGLGGWSFITRPSSINEEMIDGETPESHVLRLSRLKAKSVVAGLADDYGEDLIVLAADTVVVMDGKVLGKPEDYQNAVDILSLLSGRVHLVFTGLTVIEGKFNNQVEDCCITKVKMREFNHLEIMEYVASGDPMDKAGAYAIQNREFLPVEWVDGCLTNVMGLPLCSLVKLFKRLGKAIPEKRSFPCLYESQNKCSFTFDQL